MQILNLKQGSKEWFDARKLKMTASKATAIANCGSGLETYIYEICADFFSKSELEKYSNDDMERGNILESEARSIYEFETGNLVKEVGFCLYDEFSGCSPDGLVKDDGLVEFKCKNDKNHLKQIIEGKKAIESSYMWQMQMQMLVTGRNWCDFVCYNPNFEKHTLIFRIYADEEKQNKIKEGIEKGRNIIKSIMDKMKNKEVVDEK